jgi:hypothetical protein
MLSWLSIQQNKGGNTAESAEARAKAVKTASEGVRELDAASGSFTLARRALKTRNS